VTTVRHLPGFTAEASAYRSLGNYCTIGAPPPTNAGRQVIGPIGVPLSPFEVSNSNWTGHIRLNRAFSAGRSTSFGTSRDRQHGATSWTVSFEQQQMPGTTWPEARAQLRSGAGPGAYSPRRLPPQPYAPYPWWLQLSLIRFCNGAWVNIMTDKHNCGACGVDCGDDGTGNIQDNELCFCNSGACACSARCPFDRPTACGYQCADPGNQLTCKMVRCRNLSTDVSNCGMCGHQCNPGEVCCTGGCSNLLTDPNNCGSCGNACTVAHGWGVCVGAICKIGGCNPPWADCNGIYADGCETNLSRDSNNCGSCGHACGPNQVCCNSVCVDKQSFQTDANNCGTCGHPCNPGEVCCSGSCANLLSDPKNCGSCQNPCHPGETCCSGSCISCPSEYLDTTTCTCNCPIADRCGPMCCDPLTEVCCDNSYCVNTNYADTCASRGGCVDVGYYWCIAPNWCCPLGTRCPSCD